MNKLNKIIYNKLLIQAEEAKDRGMVKLANGIFDAIGSHPNDETLEYSYGQLKEGMYNDFWKVATKLIHYYDLDSADVEKIDAAITSFASKITQELEAAIGVDSSKVGPLDPKVPGEK